MTGLNLSDKSTKKIKLQKTNKCQNSNQKISKLKPINFKLWILNFLILNLFEIWFLVFEFF
jgi:hypothetical protein